MSSGAYGSLAGVYDRLNAEVDYRGWADFIEKCFERYAKKRPEILLDLACGTGRMSYELARRGYDVIGVDGSAEMLNCALERRLTPTNPLYLMQDMRSFELYGSVGAVVCCLDSINYLRDDGDLSECFGRVYNYLDFGGVFVFDVSSAERFERIFADNAYILEDEEGKIYCGWQNDYDEGSRICDFLLTVFREDRDGRYERFDELQHERYYSVDELRSALSDAGLEFVGIFGDYGFGAPSDDTDRWYIVARKPEERRGK